MLIHGLLVFYRVCFLTLFVALELEGLLGMLKHLAELLLIYFPCCISRYPFQSLDRQRGLEFLPKYLSSSLLLDTVTGNAIALHRPSILEKVSVMTIYHPYYLVGFS